MSNTINSLVVVTVAKLEGSFGSLEDFPDFVVPYTNGENATTGQVGIHVQYADVDPETINKSAAVLVAQRLVVKAISEAFDHEVILTNKAVEVIASKIRQRLLTPPKAAIYSNDTDHKLPSIYIPMQRSSQLWVAPEWDLLSLQAKAQGRTIGTLKLLGTTMNFGLKTTLPIAAELLSHEVVAGEIALAITKAFAFIVPDIVALHKSIKIHEHTK
jgi:hypothetical protein